MSRTARRTVRATEATQTLSTVSNIRSTAPVNCSRACPRQIPCAARPAGGSSGAGGMVGKCCHERTDQCIQFPAGAGRYGHNRMYGPEQPEYRLRFSRMFCTCAGKAEYRPYPIHGRAPFYRPASPQTAPADVRTAGCVARNTHPQTGHGHRL